MKPVQYVRALSRLNFENVFNPYSDFVEPALTELPNGDLLAVFRTGYHQPDRLMLQCKSSDRGKSWSDLVAEGVGPGWDPNRRFSVSDAWLSTPVDRPSRHDT